MKIIGKTKEWFICTLTNNEIKSLLAVNDTRKEKPEEKINTGDDLTFTTSLSNLNLLKDIRLSGSFSTLNNLKDAKSYIEKAIDVVEKCESPLIELQSKIRESQSY
jgi:hypothetical protein